MSLVVPVYDFVLYILYVVSMLFMVGLKLRVRLVSKAVRLLGEIISKDGTTTSLCF